ncbi:MAG: hypothetical protein ABIJ11_07850 [Elusimicrobiota bacterium]
MSKYLKDGALAYLTITIETLDILQRKLMEIFNQANKIIEESYKPKTPEELDKIYNDLTEKTGKDKEKVKSEWKAEDIQKYFRDQTLKDELLTISYVLRADGKGVKFSDYGELKEHFQNAKKIERLVIHLDSSINRTSYKSKRIEIGFETTFGKSYYLVEDDDNIWVEGIIKELTDILGKCKNKNYFYYSWWFIALIQIIVVAMIFLFCIWISSWIAPKLKIENAMLFVFIGFFLLFSNMWMFGSIGLKNFIENKFPQIEFRKKTTFDWLWQGVMLIFVGYIFCKLLDITWKILF